MKLEMNATGVLAIAGLGIAGFVAYKAYKGGTGLLDAAQHAVQQAAADAQSAWNNNVAAPFAQGWAYGTTGEKPYAGEKAWLYSDYGYAGIDPGTKTPIIEGEWYSDAVARRYEAEQRANGTPPAYTSPNGAAFGIYPRP
jgi:hypothetical protein